jgi:ATP-binding cassette subfamily F protein 3
VCDAFLLVADGRAEEFAGDLDDYLAWLSDRRARSGATLAPEAATDREIRRAQRATSQAERQSRLARRRPLAREAGALEREVAALELEKRELEARLSDATFYAGGNGAEVQAATRRCNEIARRLEQAEGRWLELQGELEAIGDG